MAYKVYMTKGNSSNKEYLGKAETVEEAADMLYREARACGNNTSYDKKEYIVEGIANRGFYGFGYSSYIGEVEEC